MSLQLKNLRSLLRDFKFKDIFLELNYNSTTRAPFQETVASTKFTVAPIAESGGIYVLEVTDPESDKLPTLAVRKALERAISSVYTETLLIFVNPKRTDSIFQRSVTVQGKRQTRSHRFLKGSPSEPLARSLIKLEVDFEIIDESGNVLFTEVHDRIEGSGLFGEKVTKKFFAEFNKKRTQFVKFLSWIEDESKRDWYCSVLLNRLMFIYFIAEKEFLPGGRSFLRNLLQENIRANGPNTFYTHALLPLSFFGLGAKPEDRKRFTDRFQGILYLDGGLFTVHSIEDELGINREAVEAGQFNGRCIIPDAEFVKWFDYFDQYRWTLDEDEVANDGYISPHILGYIFEKYINQKQMGAYYTKEDITGYICRNTIIPRLFDMLAEESERTGDQRFKNAVHPLPIGPHPNLLNNGLGISGGEGINRYIYPAVKRTELLPTETAYEYEQRQARYESILQDFEDGKITQIDDFITYNLDIEKLAFDFVSHIQDPEVLNAFYFRCLQTITVLDPTCGSGAFLFAALEILYPLYNAALSRMKFLIQQHGGPQADTVNWKGEINFADLEQGQATMADSVLPASIEKMAAEVKRIQDHHNADYFFRKSIIVNNLFGVDIMEEAVEICKLRLFLTLIATVTPIRAKRNLGVDPLPDIDFNILAGNTLIGYTSIADIDRLWHEVEVEKSTLAFEKDHSRLKKLVEEYGKVLGAWRLQQLGEWNGRPVTKEQVLRAVEAVRPELNKDLWNLFKDAGLATVTERSKRRQMTQTEFVRSHEPFHWLLEFPSIEAAGGFDAIVGNPPYIELAKVSNYSTRLFKTHECGNLYAPLTERSALLLSKRGRLGLIVPMSIVSTERMAPLRQQLRSKSCRVYLSNFSGDAHPSVLFDGVKFRLTIVLATSDSDGELWSTQYNRWFAEERPWLFERLSYANVSHLVQGASLIPKIGTGVHRSIYVKIQGQKTLAEILSKQGEVFYVHRVITMFVKALSFVPFFRSERDGVKKSEDYKPYVAANADVRACAVSVINSSTFFLYFTCLGDCFHCGKEHVESFPMGFDAMSLTTRAALIQMEEKLMTSFRRHSVRKTAMSQKTGRFEYDEFWQRHSKDEIDKIDGILAGHYGFKQDEVEFIVNMDLKYRLGSGAVGVLEDDGMVEQTARAESAEEWGVEDQ